MEDKSILCIINVETHSYTITLYEDGTYVCNSWTGSRHAFWKIGADNKLYVRHPREKNSWEVCDKLSHELEITEKILAELSFRNSVIKRIEEDND